MEETRKRNDKFGSHLGSAWGMGQTDLFVVQIFFLIRAVNQSIRKKKENKKSQYFFSLRISTTYSTFRTL